MAEGKILKNYTGIPYIDVDDMLYHCEIWSYQGVFPVKINS